MTGTNKTEADKPEADKIGAGQIEAHKIGADKIESHYRQQLSALMDGALPADEARFLLRRMQHDGELAQCVNRWHLAGDVLRGEAQAIVPTGFAERVAAAIASEPALVPVAAVSRQSRWSGGLRWGSGAALAASVALVALFVARPPSSPGVSETPSAIVSQVAEPSVAPSIAATDVSAAAPTATGAPAAILAAAVIATASVPQRTTSRRGTRSQSQRATLRTPARSERPMVAAATRQGDASSVNDLFGNTTAAPSRPWPSAVLPQAPATSAFTVDYGGTVSPSFYPFQPRLPGAQPASGETTPASEGAPPP